eukprot:5371731-Alexandrium_andersonii.AAC.1
MPGNFRRVGKAQARMSTAWRHGKRSRGRRGSQVLTQARSTVPLGCLCTCSHLFNSKLARKAGAGHRTKDSGSSSQAVRSSLHLIDNWP